MDYIAKLKDSTEWVEDNVLKPAVNAGVLEPYNAVANCTNYAARHTAGHELLPKVDQCEVMQAQFMSTDYCVQAISSGLAAAIPYAIAGRVTGGTLGTAGRICKLEGVASTMIASEKTASILGAALYDGSRDLRPGETRFGNAAGAAAAFSIFEHGNALAKDMPLLTRFGGRALIGSAGAETGFLVSRTIASGQLPDLRNTELTQELAHTAISGGFMNMALPEVQRFVGLNWSSSKPEITGRGLQDLSQYEPYFADESKFKELQGSDLWQHLRYRHDLETTKQASKIVSDELPWFSRSTAASERLGRALTSWGMNDTSSEELSKFVPQPLRRNLDGQPMTHSELLSHLDAIRNKINESSFEFNYANARRLYLRMRRADTALDARQFDATAPQPFEDAISKSFTVADENVFLLRDIARAQEQGLFPDNIRKVAGSDPNRPVYEVSAWRPATEVERALPLMEVVKNLKLVDYGFSDLKGKPINGKISLAVHDSFDHLYSYTLLDQAGLLREDPSGRNYRTLLRQLGNPDQKDVFNRESELIASIAYNHRAFSIMPEGYEPPIRVSDLVENLLQSPQLANSPNQQEALNYLMRLMREDPQGESREARLLRHVYTSVHTELNEQTRKTNRSVKESDDSDSAQRIMIADPEYLSLMVDLVRLLDTQESRDQLLAHNLSIEQYLRAIAASLGTLQISALHTEARRAPYSTMAAPDVPDAVRERLERYPGTITRKTPIINQ